MPALKGCASRLRQGEPRTRYWLPLVVISKKCSSGKKEMDFSGPTVSIRASYSTGSCMVPTTKPHRQLGKNTRWERIGGDLRTPSLRSCLVITIRDEYSSI